MLRRVARLGAIGLGVYVLATKGGRKRLRRARVVYTEEVATGTRPIEAVGTAVAAFVGLAEGGPLPR